MGITLSNVLHPIDFLEGEANALLGKQAPAAAAAGGAAAGAAAGVRIAAAIETTAIVVTTVGVVTALALFYFAQRKG